MLSHFDQNTTFSFEAEPECALNRLVAIAINTIAKQ